MTPFPPPSFSWQKTRWKPALASGGFLKWLLVSTTVAVSWSMRMLSSGWLGLPANAYGERRWWWWWRLQGLGLRRLLGGNLFVWRLRWASGKSCSIASHVASFKLTRTCSFALLLASEVAVSKVFLEMYGNCNVRITQPKKRVTARTRHMCWQRVIV